jgi:hypothetical protein
MEAFNDFPSVLEISVVFFSVCNWKQFEKCIILIFQLCIYITPYIVFIKCVQ